MVRRRVPKRAGPLGPRHYRFPAFKLFETHLQPLLDAALPNLSQADKELVSRMVWCKHLDKDTRRHFQDEAKQQKIKQKEIQQKEQKIELLQRLFAANLQKIQAACSLESEEKGVDQLPPEQCFFQINPSENQHQRQPAYVHPQVFCDTPSAAQSVPIPSTSGDNGFLCPSLTADPRYPPGFPVPIPVCPPSSSSFFSDSDNGARQRQSGRNGLPAATGSSTDIYQPSTMHCGMDNNGLSDSFQMQPNSTVQQVHLVASGERPRSTQPYNAAQETVRKRRKPSDMNICEHDKASNESQGSEASDSIHSEGIPRKRTKSSSYNYENETGEAAAPFHNPSAIKEVVNLTNESCDPSHMKYKENKIENSNWESSCQTETPTCKSNESNKRESGTTQSDAICLSCSDFEDCYNVGWSSSEVSGNKEKSLSFQSNDTSTEGDGQNQPWNSLDSFRSDTSVPHQDTAITGSWGDNLSTQEMESFNFLHKDSDLLQAAMDLSGVFDDF